MKYAKSIPFTVKVASITPREIIISKRGLATERKAVRKGVRLLMDAIVHKALSPDIFAGRESHSRRY